MVIQVYNLDTDQSAQIDVAADDTLSDLKRSLIGQGFLDGAANHVFTVRPAGRVVSPSQSVGSLKLDQDAFIEISSAPDLSQSPFADAKLAINRDPRCPVVLLLDNSTSMSGAPINALNAGILVLKKELEADILASRRAEIAMISFGPVNVITDFTDISHFTPTPLEVAGATPMGEAIELGISMIEARRRQYRQNGIKPYRPWIFLITDGAPTDEIDRAIAKIKDGEASNHFSFYAIGVQNADMKVLASLNPTRDPLKMDGIRFSAFFKWLSDSLHAVSRSQPGDRVPFENPTAPRGWATNG